MFKKSTFLLLFLSAGALFGQKLSPKEIAKHLCSPELHGRGYVQSGDSLAAAFLAKQFELYELKALKKDGYLQEFSFPVNTFPNDILVQLGEDKLIPGVDYLIDPKSGSFTGKLFYEVLNREIISDPTKLRTFVDALMNNPAPNKCLVMDPSGLGKDTVKSMRLMASDLSNYLPVIELSNEKLTWSVSTSAKKYPIILLKSAKWNGNSELFIQIENKLIRNHKAYNVIAYVPAKRKTKKFIFITAHYDHLGRMGTEAYFPGANDNASGTSILFGIAEKFINNPSKYNLGIIAFAGEEAGLLGSEFFVNEPLVPLKNIKFLVNLDIMGSGEEGITVVNGSVFKEEYERLVKLNEKLNSLSVIKSRGKAANSDHYHFSEKGVPAFFFYTMGPNKNYHDVFDTFDSLSFAEFEDLQILVATFIRTF